MEIKREQIKVKDLIKGYEEKGQDGIEGIVAYDGKLDVRPAYQREFIYKEKERNEVIKSIMKGFPLNVMYWAKTEDDRFELMDGQQRTISICRYSAERERTFAVDYRYFFNLEEDEKERFLEYELDIYICDGTPTEVLDWFRVINIAGLKLTEQELRNTAYTGKWLAEAKHFFSKPNCIAYNLGKNYLLGSAIRQDYLETVLKWISRRDNLPEIESYMALHQNDDNANQIIMYYRNIISWIELTFTTNRKQMKGVDWGLLYDRFKDDTFDTAELENEIKALLIDKDVSNKSGVYPYVLTRDEKYLNIRAFDEADKIEAYERQNGICAKCGKQFNLEEMEADHITPWSEGGKTIAENCQMLCKTCNRIKSNV